MARDKFNFDEVQRRFAEVKRRLPIIISNRTQRYFVDAFRKQAWDGQAWKEPKRRIAGTDEYKYGGKAGRTRATLVGSGALRRAVNMSAREKSFDRITFVVHLPYAEVHNDGSDIMPRRRYMGQTKELTGIQLQTVKTGIMKIWQA